jgi:hypothetical protein
MIWQEIAENVDDYFAKELLRSNVLDGVSLTSRPASTGLQYDLTTGIRKLFSRKSLRM